MQFLARERRKFRRRAILLGVGLSADRTDSEGSESISSHPSSAVSADPLSNVMEEEQISSVSPFSVESTDEMMVICLEAVDEDNYGSLISALKEWSKRWEFTNINGERILKILP